MSYTDFYKFVAISWRSYAQLSIIGACAFLLSQIRLRRGAIPWRSYAQLSIIGACAFLLSQIRLRRGAIPWRSYAPLFWIKKKRRVLRTFKTCNRGVELKLYSQALKGLRIGENMKGGYWQVDVDEVPLQVFLFILQFLHEPPQQ